MLNCLLVFTFATILPNALAAKDCVNFLDQVVIQRSSSPVVQARQVLPTAQIPPGLGVTPAVPTQIPGNPTPPVIPAPVISPGPNSVLTTPSPPGISPDSLPVGLPTPLVSANPGLPLDTRPTSTASTSVAQLPEESNTVLLETSNYDSGSPSTTSGASSTQSSFFTSSSTYPAPSTVSSSNTSSSPSPAQYRLLSLTPIFVFLGALAGGLAGWLGYALYTNTRRNDQNRYEGEFLNPKYQVITAQEKEKELGFETLGYDKSDSKDRTKTSASDVNEDITVIDVVDACADSPSKTPLLSYQNDEHHTSKPSSQPPSRTRSIHSRLLDRIGSWRGGMGRGGYNTVNSLGLGLGLPSVNARSPFPNRSNQRGKTPELEEGLVSSQGNKITLARASTTRSDGTRYKKLAAYLSPSIYSRVSADDDIDKLPSSDLKPPPRIQDLPLQTSASRFSIIPAIGSAVMSGMEGIIRQSMRAMSGTGPVKIDLDPNTTMNGGMSTYGRIGGSLLVDEDDLQSKKKDVGDRDGDRFTPRPLRAATRRTAGRTTNVGNGRSCKDRIGQRVRERMMQLEPEAADAGGNAQTEEGKEERERYISDRSRPKTHSRTRTNQLYVDDYPRHHSSPISAESPRRNVLLASPNLRGTPPPHVDSSILPASPRLVGLGSPNPEMEDALFFTSHSHGKSNWSLRSPDLRIRDYEERDITHGKGRAGLGMGTGTLKPLPPPPPPSSSATPPMRSPPETPTPHRRQAIRPATRTSHSTSRSPTKTPCRSPGSPLVNRETTTRLRGPRENKSTRRKVVEIAIGRGQREVSHSAWQGTNPRGGTNGSMSRRQHPGSRRTNSNMKNVDKQYYNTREAVRRQKNASNTRREECVRLV